jgi:hypothetical protein
MFRRTYFLAFAAMLLLLATYSLAQAWGGCHYSYHYGGYGGGGYRYGGGYHYGGYGAYAGVRYGGYGGYGAHYGYHYGGYGGDNAYRYGYYRRY